MSGMPSTERVLEVRARALGPRAVEVSVIDRGHGIGDEERARLSRPFYTTTTEGMGMGLNICRSIIEFHDGRLIVDANPEAVPSSPLRCRRSLRVSGRPECLTRRSISSMTTRPARLARLAARI